jgi:hypothetical protein
MMEGRIALTEKFVEARNLAAKRPEDMIRMCEELLREAHLEEAVRAGDVLAVLIEHCYASRDLKEAYRHVQSMEARGIAPHAYVDADILNAIYEAEGVNIRGKEGRGGSSEAKMEEEKHDTSVNSDLDEEIDEVIIIVYVVIEK